MKEKIKKLEKLISEIKKTLLSHMDLVYYNKLVDISDIINELYDHIKCVSNDIEMSRVMYHERKMNTKTGTAFNELKGEGTLIGLGTKHKETSAIIRTEEGKIINHPLNLVEFINIHKPKL